MNKRLHVRSDIRRDLEQRSVAVHVADTREAVDIYKDVTVGTLVAGLFHST
jgi:hypothetical protein